MRNSLNWFAVIDEYTDHGEMVILYIMTTNILVYHLLFVTQFKRVFFKDFATPKWLNDETFNELMKEHF